MTFDREKQRLLAIGGKWEHMKGVTLSPEVISFLTDALGFPNMAPVQSQCIPLLLSHYDTVVEAVTGSGKTLAYLVPMMEMMMREKNIEVSNNNAQAVLGAIVVPSRELAQQVFKVAKKFVAYINKEKKTVFTTACFIGGRSLEVDIDIFNSHGANILIGTPGRLYELLVASKYSHLFNVGSLELLILDEADKLLELGFKPKLDALLKRFPKQRRTGLFSATQTQEVAELARAGMRNPVSIAVRVASISTVGDDEAKPQIPDTITNYYAIRKTEDKMDALVSFIENNKKEKILVYAMTCAAVEWMSECLSKVLLKSKGVNLFTIHGQMKLSCRQKAFSSVNEANSCVLVCTDVAARGLDIPEVGIVIQYDAPVSPSTFIHRIGRTARMGRAGKSLILLSPNEAEYVSFMKLQNVTLVPFTEEDDREENDFANVDPKRTLASAPKKKMIHNHKKNKQDKTVSIKKELMALNKGKKRLKGGGFR